MKNLKGLITVIGIIVKYGAVVTAVIKGVQVVSDELSKIDLSSPTPVSSVSTSVDLKKVKDE